jgi:flagellin-like hook-associated protein FlgL
MVAGVGSTAQIQLDLARMGQQLADIQNQIGSGARAADLKGFGGQAGALLSTQSLKAATDAKSSVIDQLQARFDVQGAALQQVADGARALALSIRTAISANDGRGVATDLELNFDSVVAALNTNWNGQPLFAGERQSGSPIQIDTLQQLVNAAGPSDIYSEAARPQTIDLGAGAPIALAKRASDMSQGLFDAMKNLQVMLNSSAGGIGQPISQANQNTLNAIAAQLDAQASSFDSESGHAGQVQAQLKTQSTQLQAQSDLLTKEIGDQRDADPAALSIQLNLLMTQYQASAKVFADLSKLTLLNYL